MSVIAVILYTASHRSSALHLSAFVFHNCLRSPVCSCQNLKRFLGKQPSDQILAERIGGKEK